MDSSKKLYIALAVLVALGAFVYIQQKDKKKDAAAHSLAARSADLPNLTVSEEDKKAIDRIEIFRPAFEPEEGAGGAPQEAKPEQKVVLTKIGEAEGDAADKWELAEPVKYRANDANVKSLLDNLEKLKTQEVISENSDTYDKWGVSDEKGLHAVFKKGEEVVTEMYFGDSGSRGQMVRVGGTDGVFVVKGYSKYLYDRDASTWRNKSIFKFEDKDAASITIKNENGEFAFTRDNNTWAGTFNGASFERFKTSKVDDLLRAYKSLNASKFGDDKSDADVGLTEPTATVTIQLKGDGDQYVLSVGDTAEGTSRWVKASNADTIFSISSWSADWATADLSKFQEKEKDADDEDSDGDDKKAAMPAMDPHAGHDHAH